MTTLLFSNPENPLRLVSHISIPSHPRIPEPKMNLFCCFQDDLTEEFPVSYADNDTYQDLKLRIKMEQSLQDQDIKKWKLYRPGHVLDKAKPFIPSTADIRLPPKRRIKDIQNEPGDPDIDVVIVCRQQDRSPPLKRRVELLNAGGTTLPLHSMTWLGLTSPDLIYRPPRPSTLLNSPGRAWDYQVSPELINILHTEVQRHFNFYKQGYMDKSTIPLYLFLSGAGTGKSRNSSELWQTTYRCFNGGYFPKMDGLAHQISNAFVFHISLENGTSMWPSETDPMAAIGSRMLLQLIQDDNRFASLDDVHTKFHPTTPLALINFFRKQDPSRAFFLVVDGLKNIRDRFGESVFMATLTALGDIAQQGFIIVCGTSTISDPVERILKGSRRHRVVLPCAPLDAPKINNQPVFNSTGLVQKVLIQDCGGHGRALELLMDITPTLPRDASTEVKFLVVDRLHQLYSGALPGQSDAMAMVRVVMGHRHLYRDECIPGTSITADEVMQNGLVRFEAIDNSDRPIGYLTVPYVWLLALAASHRGNPFFEELQMLDYRDFRAIEDSSLPGHFSWPDFECLLVKLRKIKSQVFEDGSYVTLEDIHQGAFMADDTKSICMWNHHLSDDIARHRIMSKTIASNHNHWVIHTNKFGEIDLRKHKHIVRNAAGAPAADALISLETNPVRNECLQFKNTRGPSNFHQEREKAAAPDDIFVFFTTSSIPSLQANGTYDVPPGSVVVMEENWKHYIGPYAGRSYLFAKQLERLSGSTS